MSMLRALVLLVAGLSLSESFAWTPSSLAARPWRDVPSLYAVGSDDADDWDESSGRKGESTPEDDTFMASLRQRISQVSDRESKMPIVVLDAILPMQTMKIESEDERFVALITHLIDAETDGSTFGMLGAQGHSNEDGMQKPLNYGSEIKIVGTPRLTDSGGVQIELRGGRRMKIAGEVATSDEGWTEARVEFLDFTREEAAEEAETLSRAISKATEFTSPNGNMPGFSSLVNRWIELAKTKERSPGQIDRLLADIGEIPENTSPSRRAYWIGALINPLPAMGVSLEIRPALLSARTAEARVTIASNGILTSIRHMDGSKPLW